MFVFFIIATLASLALSAARKAGHDDAQCQQISQIVTIQQKKQYGFILQCRNTPKEAWTTRFVTDGNGNPLPLDTPREDPIIDQK